MYVLLIVCSGFTNIESFGLIVRGLDSAGRPGDFALFPNIIFSGALILLTFLSGSQYTIRGG